VRSSTATTTSATAADATIACRRQLRAARARRKKEFVERYRLGSSFWANRTPAEFPLVTKELKTNLTDLAQYYHAAAQRSKKKPDYHEAARWYREFLQSFPDDPESAGTNYLLAETLFESEDFRAAANTSAWPTLTCSTRSLRAGYAALCLRAERVARRRCRRI
jgi:TolA-binding protein